MTSTLIANVSTPTAFQQKITSNAVATILNASQGIITLMRLEVNENNGSTPNLTVEIYDGTSSYYLGADVGASRFTWVAKAVTAKQSVVFDGGYVIPQNSKLRITSSDAAGRFDVFGLYIFSRRTG